MSRAATLALTYLGLVALCQVMLWSALPNVGMGGLAIVYLVWPILALSALVLWCILRKTANGQTMIFAAASTLMLVGSLAAHPQDGQASVPQKLERILHHVAGA